MGTINTICHSDCRFYCIFGTSSPRTTILSENCKKIPNIEGEYKYLVLLAIVPPTIARAENG